LPRLPAIAPALLVAALAAAPVEGGAATHWVWECKAERTLTHGSAYAIRTYDRAGQLYSGDSLLWDAAGYDPARPRAPIEWHLSYPWSAARDEPFDDRRIKLTFRIQHHEPLPNVVLLQIQRPMPVVPHGVIDSAALVTLAFRYSDRDPLGGSGDLPLGDLLAYGTGYDELGWNLTASHDQFGHARHLAKGALSLAALREAVIAFKDMRSELKRRGKDFRRTCTYRERLLPPAHP
jgi:hypothetical protein